MKRFLLALTVSSWLTQSTTAQFAPNIPIETRTLDQIYLAAQKEHSTLQIASGGDAHFQGLGIVNAWKQRIPLVALNLTIDLSKYHDSRIDRAFYDREEVVDVAVLQTLQDFQRWKGQNRLMFYKPATFGDIYSGEKDLDGAFLPVGIYSLGPFYYDPTKLSPADVPSSFADLLNPVYKGKLILTYPNDDDAICYLFSLIISRYGFSWLDGLVKQDIQWVRGTGTPGIVLAGTHNQSSNTRSLSFTTLGKPPEGDFMQVREPSAPEQYMSWTQTAAILASTKRPESAKLFISWLLSDESQTQLAATGPTVRKLLNRVSGFDVFESNTTQIDGFRVFMRDRALVDWWRLQFETALGTAQGPSPLALY